MPSLKELKAQIENSNALGVANLTDKGVDVPANATTYDIMSRIAEVSGGSDVSVEYIESTGTQWIDTGVIPTNHRVVAKFQYTTLPSTSDVRALFGNFTTTWTNAFYMCWYKNAWYYASGMNSQEILSGATLCTDLQEIDFNNYDGKFLINGVEYGDTNGTVNTSQTMPVFCRREANGSILSSALSSIRLYYFKIYNRETEELVRDLIPAFDENGVICLYDNVTETYFYNQGSGEFKGNFIEKGLAEAETLIDESGVLDSTEESVNEKVEQLIDKASNFTAGFTSEKYKNWLKVNGYTISTFTLTSTATADFDIAHTLGRAAKSIICFRADLDGSIVTDKVCFAISMEGLTTDTATNRLKHYSSVYSGFTFGLSSDGHAYRAVLENTEEYIKFSAANMLTTLKWESGDYYLAVI